MIIRVWTDADRSDGAQDPKKVNKQYETAEKRLEELKGKINHQVRVTEGDGVSLGSDKFAVPLSLFGPSLTCHPPLAITPLNDLPGSLQCVHT